MNDLGTLILIGIIIVAVVLLLQRLMNRQPNYSQQGNEFPHTDNPNISSHGGFGGQSQLPQRPQQQGQPQRPQNDSPNVASHGGFGSGSTSSMAQGRDKVNTAVKPTVHADSQKAPERTRGNDDPNVSSHGGFGKPK